MHLGLTYSILVGSSLKQFCQLNHTQICSWNQPVLSNKG